MTRLRLFATIRRLLTRQPVPLPVDLEGLATVEHIDAPGRGPWSDHQWHTLFSTEHGRGWYVSEGPPAAGLGKIQLVRYRQDGDRVKIITALTLSGRGSAKQQCTKY